MKTLLLLFSVISLFKTDLLGQSKTSNKLKRDLVPDAETAIKIAEAIWLPIYGKHIYIDTPFVATMKDSTTWKVNGTLPAYFDAGGTPYIEIRKRDCMILKVTHGK